MAKRPNNTVKKKHLEMPKKRLDLRILRHFSKQFFINNSMSLKCDQKHKYLNKSKDIQFYLGKIWQKLDVQEHKTSTDVHGHAKKLTKNVKKCQKSSKDVKVDYFFACCT